MDNWSNNVPDLGTVFFAGFVLWCIVGLVFSIHLADKTLFPGMCQGTIWVFKTPLAYLIRHLGIDLDWAYT